MKKIVLATFAFILSVGFGAGSASAQMMDGGNPMVGGAAMYKTKNIVENAVNSKDHTTLVAAVKAAGLVDTLESAGPFTVFAPVNSAFDALPAGTVDTLLKPENKAMLTRILTYHVIAGNYSSKDIAKAIRKGNGKAEFTTVSGGKLWASMDGSTLVLTDEKGGQSRVTIADVKQSNGVIHVVDAVLLPN
ncbi:MAG: fasciclin domain-containing protein [Pyrinomonadaceae bacterium]